MNKKKNPNWKEKGLQERRKKALKDSRARKQKKRDRVNSEYSFHEEKA